MTREAQDKNARRTISIYRNMASAYPAVEKVGKSFDGKILNIRFERALSEATGLRVRVRKFETYVDIGALCDCVTYPLAKIKNKDMADGKRINAETLAQSALKLRNWYLKESAEIEDVMQNLDEYKEQINRAIEAINAIVEPLNGTAREIYGLNAFGRSA